MTLLTSWRASESFSVKWNYNTTYLFGFPGGSNDKQPASHAGDVGLISGSGRSPGGGNENGNPLQYPCPENPTDREAWRSAVHRFAKSWTWGKRLSTHASFWLLGESDKIICVETSLVAQWLGVHLPMQGTRAQFLVQEDPTCLWTTKLLHHNYWAQTLEPPHRNYLSRRLPSMRREKPPWWERPRTSKKTHHSQKNNYCFKN